MELRDPPREDARHLEERRRGGGLRVRDHRGDALVAARLPAGKVVRKISIMSRGRTLGATWTVSPTLVVDITLATSRFDQECVPPDFGVNYGTDVFGIPGTNADSPGQNDPFAGRYSGLRDRECQ